MKRIALLMSLAVAVTCSWAGSSAQADVWLPGSWGLDVDWDPNSNSFTDDGGGLWSNSLTGLNAGQRYEFKIVEDLDADGIGTWDNDTIIPPGSNAAVYADASGNVSINYDANTQRYLVSNFPTAGPWIAVGDFQDEAGAAGDWDNSATETQLVDIGGGLFQFVTPVLAAGDYQWKATTNGWDFQVGVEGTNINGATELFTVNGSQFVTMTLDSNTQTISSSISAVPEPGSVAVLAMIGLTAIARRRRS